ncbi:MAG: hypothetical protein JSW26_27825 [Desulfobacterales bacterium]|nr:MAG: hypothetical protein JSW26_27825 [Desulfobacterales bacterium]
MITNEEAQGNYNSAREALNRIIRSNSATEEDRQRAEKQRDNLILNYVGRQIDDVHERSAAYVTFIKAMAAFIEDLGPQRSLEGLQTLQGIIDKAAILIKTVKEEEQRRKSDQGK